MINNEEHLEDFEALLNEYLPEDEKPGKRVKGIIESKERNFTYVDVPGQPAIVRVRSEELEGYNIGDEVEIQIVTGTEEGDIVIGSRRKIDAEEGLKKIEAAYENKEILEGKIVKRINGGYVVEVLKQQCFLPNSLSQIPLAEGDKFVGQKFDVMVKEVKTDKRGKKITVSRRDITLMNEEKEFALLHVGDLVEVEVADVLDFGLTVRVGSLRGFIHMSEISWKKVEKLSAEFKKGDRFKAQVISLDPEKRNVKLSIKVLTKNPWETAKETLKVEQDIDGKVVKFMPYGVIVEVMEGVEGLVHISDFTWNKKKVNMHDFVKEGDSVKVRVLEFLPEERRLKLGLKQLAANPWDQAEEKYGVGKVLTGKIIDVKPFGIFVEVEKGVDAFIHQSDFAWTGRKTYNLGDSVEFKVIEMSLEENKLKGSVKALTKSPWDQALEIYKVGDIVEKPVKSIQDFGMFLSLEKGVDGFVPVQLASKDFIKKLSDKYEVGQVVRAEIVEIDQEKKRIKLSVRKVEQEVERNENKELIEKYGVSESK